MTTRHGEPQEDGRAGTMGACLPGRRSASAEASLAAESARVRAMTSRERMELALALGRRRLALAALRTPGELDP